MIGYGLGKIMALWICVFLGYSSVPLLVIPIVCLPMELEAALVIIGRHYFLLSKGINNSTKAVVSDEFEKFLTTADYNIRIVQQSDTVQKHMTASTRCLLRLN